MRQERGREGEERRGGQSCTSEGDGGGAGGKGVQGGGGVETSLEGDFPASPEMRSPKNRQPTYCAAQCGGLRAFCENLRRQNGRSFGPGMQCISPRGCERAAVPCTLYAGYSTKLRRRRGGTGPIILRRSRGGEGVVWDPPPRPTPRLVLSC